jgi:hypothetical protein
VLYSTLLHFLVPPWVFCLISTPWTHQEHSHLRTFALVFLFSWNDFPHIARDLLLGLLQSSTSLPLQFYPALFFCRTLVISWYWRLPVDFFSSLPPAKRKQDLVCLFIFMPPSPQYQPSKCLRTWNVFYLFPFYPSERLLSLVTRWQSSTFCGFKLSPSRGPIGALPLRLNLYRCPYFWCFASLLPFSGAFRSALKPTFIQVMLVSIV